MELWRELKKEAKEQKKLNYIQDEKPHTWTAFTYGQMVPQMISFAVARWTAQGVIRGLVSSRLA